MLYHETMKHLIKMILAFFEDILLNVVLSFEYGSKLTDAI